jgi:hypothetical protein
VEYCSDDARIGSVKVLPLLLREVWTMILSIGRIESDARSLAWKCGVAGDDVVEVEKSCANECALDPLES